MTWRLLIILISLSACASTVWKNDMEAPPKKSKYSDQLINYNTLSEEVISTLRQYISGKLRELIDYANNASNENYASDLRAYSKEQIGTIINLFQNNGETNKVEIIIQQLKNTTLDQFVIQAPSRKPDSVLISDILFRGEEFIQAQIKRNLKIFGSDTLNVWEVEFNYTAKENRK